MVTTNTVKKSQKGFTLIEITLVLAILTILLSTGLPGLSSLINNNRQSTAINRFSTLLALARSEAVQRFRHIVLCPSNNRINCTGGYSWQDGYLVFEDSNANKQRDHNEALLAITPPTSNHMKITTSRSRGKLVFYPSGMAYGSNTTIRFCDKNSQIQPKAIIISNSGRARISAKSSRRTTLKCD